MSEKKDGGPAFPLGANEYAGHGPSWGMSLRDYFAAKAMQSHLLTHSDCKTLSIAEWSYQVADAMLRAREAS